MAEHPLDAVALTVKPLAVADRIGAVRFWRDDGANAALFEVVADRIGIIRRVGDEGAWRPLRQIDQRAVAFAVRRFAGRKVRRQWGGLGHHRDNEFYWRTRPASGQELVDESPFSA